MGARQKLRTFSGSPGEDPGVSSDSQIKKVMEGFTGGQMGTPGEEEEHRDESRHSSDPGETLGPRVAGEWPHSCKAILQVSTGWPAEAGIRSSLISGDTLPGDRRRELERGA